jgi:beta-lactam-binding protein with PASTA domain
MNPLRPLKWMIFASLLALLSAGRSFGQSKCPEAPSPGAVGLSAKLAAEAHVARPQAPELYMAGPPKQATGPAKAEVQTICVPNFTGMTLDEAKAAIEKTRGLRFGSATPPNGGTVTAQYPPPFRYVPVNTPVTLELTPPQPVSHLRQVPDITHMDESALEAFLKRDGLAYGGSTNTETTKYPPGSILQDPPAGNWVEENTPVFRYQVTVPPQPPPALPQPTTSYQLSLVPSAKEISVNEQVRFTAVLTPATESAGYAFDFGDGSPSGDMSGQNTADNQYTKDGTFTATVVARPPEGDVLQATATIQVHAISWTVTLRANPRLARPNTEIVFEASLLPRSPAPEQAQYLFYFDKDKKPVVSTTPTVRRSFSGAGMHSAVVFVKDADGHQFQSNDVTVKMQPPPPPPVLPWVLGLISVAVFALAGLKIAHKIAIGRLKYEWVADVRGAQLVAAVPDGLVKAGFDFRVVYPPLDIGARSPGPIVTRVE